MAPPFALIVSQGGEEGRDLSAVYVIASALALGLENIVCAILSVGG